MTHPLHLFSFCPRCGSDTFLPCNAKALACAACDLQLYFNAAAAVAGIIVNSANQILVTTRAYEPGKGKLDLPGGFVDYAESAESALKREIFEELNIKLDSVSFFCSFPNTYTYRNVTYNTLDLAFICKCSNLEYLCAQDDVSGFYFINPHEINSKDIAFESIKNIIATYCEKVRL